MENLIESSRTNEEQVPPSSSDACYEEFLQLFLKEREHLSAYLYSLLPNPADAEDVFQRCSLLLWRKFADFDQNRSFLSWACGVAFYEVKNFLRSAQRDHLQFNTELMSQLADRRLETLERSPDLLPYLQECLKRLPAAERELVQAAYGSNESLRKFAEDHGKALQTIYNRLGRIRRTLLNCVQNKLATES